MDSELKRKIISATIDGFRFWLENDGELAELPLSLQGRIGVSICQVTRKHVISNQIVAELPQHKPRRSMSAKHRKAVSERMRKYWAKRRRKAKSSKKK